VESERKKRDKEKNCNLYPGEQEGWGTSAPAATQAELKKSEKHGFIQVLDHFGADLLATKSDAYCRAQTDRKKRKKQTNIMYTSQTTALNEQGRCVFKVV
jgi:hypothetical protein